MSTNAPSSLVTEIVYTWPDGREEVRYRRPFGSDDAKGLINEIEKMRSRLGEISHTCPYNYRTVHDHH